MQLGTVVGGRFEVSQYAASGGVGVVYRARDLTCDSYVALKLLHTLGPAQIQRFEREAQTLADLVHPGFVRYIAHGLTPDGSPYLVMEWLEGEDLSTRLERGRLSISDSVQLAKQVARALSAAHQRGLVHRDIKPSNLWLQDGQISRAKILDLGLARPVARARVALSQSGDVVGTPSYMAPEQARGSSELDARADIFALGCVLYECLTGEPPFVGDSMMAVLAKIVFEDAPRVSQKVPDVPPALDQLVATMLARDPRRRPADSTVLASALAALEHATGTPALPAPVSERVTALTTREQRVLCVLMGGPANADLTNTLTATSSSAQEQRSALRAIAQEYGGELELLANGCIVATFAAAGTATDLATQAARCAFALRPLLDGTCLALAIGTGQLGQALPIGEAVERAVRLLPGTPPGALRVDDVSRALLEGRYVIERGLLTEEREVTGGERLLLGKRTLCVGRERELSTLEAAIHDCLQDRQAQVVIVSAPAGAGKSRLRHEFLRRHQGDAEVWTAQGDAMHAGAPLGLLARALRSSLGLNAAMPGPLQQRLIRAQVERVVARAHASRVAEFLGEQVGVPFPDEGSVSLRAARQDPVLMGDQLLRAWEDWLQAKAAVRPIVLVVEDLHWGDASTVRFVDSALRKLQDSPIFVLAMGRPEMHAQFPDLWRDRGAMEIRLRQLPKRACEELVRQVLGDQTSPELIARVVGRAEGNAFYLEELIRTVAEGVDHFPGSVLAMLQLRLTALPDEQRLVLRAGSVFGGVFYAGGVAAMLGGIDGKLLDTQLRELVDREWLSAARESRIKGETAYTFRHDLAREAAYTMLTEADRVVGHRLAADWLSKVGYGEAIVLAEHYERGATPLAASGCYQLAAEQAFELNDFNSALARAERAITCGAQAERLGEIRVLQAEAHNLLSQWRAGESCGREAQERLYRGSALWAHAVHQRSWSYTFLSDVDEVERRAEELLSEPLPAPMDRLHALAHASVATHLMLLNRAEKLPALLERLREAERDLADPLAAGAVFDAFARHALTAGEPARALTFLEKAVEHFDRAGSRRRTLCARGQEGWLLSAVGQYERAEQILSETVSAAEELDYGFLLTDTVRELCLLLSNTGRAHAALELARTRLQVRTSEPGLDTYYTDVCVARFLNATGDPVGAELLARGAVESSSAIPTVFVKALATHAESLLALGRVEAGLTEARRAQEVLRAMGSTDDWEAPVRLVFAQALERSGDAAGARCAIATARERLLERALRIEAPELRDSFLHRVPAHARTLDFARALLGDTAA